MNINDFVRGFENAMEDITAGSLAAGTKFRELAGWDSLAALSVIAMVDADYGVELTADELKKSQTIEDIFNVVAAKKK
jgi:acyl carrier protein